MEFRTHSTVVAPLTRIRRERLLPSAGKVIAKMGQEVSPVQVVARTPLKTNFHILPASEMIGVPADELPSLLLVKNGDMVEPGMSLVKKRGLGRKGLVSPVEGRLFDVINGRLILQSTSGWIELRAMVQGRVVNHVENRGVILEINGSRIQAMWDSGKEGFGVIRLLAETAVSPLAGDQIGADAPGKILVTGKINQASTLVQAERAGVSGFIAGSMVADLIQAALAVSYPIFLTDGFGDQGMSDPIFRLLQESDARDVALFSSPANQWGNRPEIVIPLAAIPGEDPPPAGQPIAPGQLVRILRPPFASQIGEIIRLYHHAQPTTIHTKAHGADVKLADGQVVFIPVTNLDAII